MITALRKSRAAPAAAGHDASVGPAAAILDCKRQLDAAVQAAVCMQARLGSQVACSLAHVAQLWWEPQLQCTPLLASVSSSAIEQQAVLPSKDRPWRGAVFSSSAGGGDAAGEPEGAGEPQPDERVLISEVGVWGCGVAGKAAASAVGLLAAAAACPPCPPPTPAHAAPPC